jgi:predicted ATPase
VADIRANVISIDALERFRSSLLVFIERATLVIDEVNDESNRTRMWLQSDQRLYWNAEIRRRGQKLDEAQAQLLAARLSALGEATHAHHQAVRNAHEAVKAAEGKLRATIEWNRQYDGRVAPLSKQLNKLDNLLNSDMQKAVHFLTEAVKNLSEYAETRAPGAAEPGPPPSTIESSESPKTE